MRTHETSLDSNLLNLFSCSTDIKKSDWLVKMTYLTVDSIFNALQYVDFIAGAIQYNHALRYST